MTLLRSDIEKYNIPGPRYTSYPTAPEWEDQFPESRAADAIHRFGQSNRTLSLYIHIPFCQSMCYYCGCNVIIRKDNPQTGDKYLDYLEKEMDITRGHMKRKPLLKQFHIGGGTPNFLTIDQMQRLMEMVSTHFDFDPTAEIAIEIDPRVITPPQLAHLKEVGFNRLSMGIQDFNPIVQKAVNRIQPYEDIQTLIEQARSLQFESINCDLIYGLPFQTTETFSDTIEKIVTLSPDRIALYSYAHVPWLKSHQSLIREKDLPESQQKMSIFMMATKQLTASGYQAIAMDHFAKESDDMAKAFKTGKLHRNFMGYTLKPADDYLGMGTSAIGLVDHTFIQNTKDIKTYYSTLDSGLLPVSRGKSLTQDDRIRQWVIQQLMCSFLVDTQQFESIFGISFRSYFEKETDHLKWCKSEGLLIEKSSVLIASEKGRLFVRLICMGFDAYLPHQKQEPAFSKAV
ncbi:MAG: oxygen-independent coproporphyrinogen III oxidase [Candidatus Margulisbacteria bacterium]|nr:oxygen-independent coproporphyrinogen III oxidase [Candidatus Margulisiibacteriota bacterium]